MCEAPFQWMRPFFTISWSTFWFGKVYKIEVMIKLIMPFCSMKTGFEQIFSQVHFDMGPD